MNTRLEWASKQSIKNACDLLRQGELVAIPTETVYGLAANACDEQAVKRIFEAKGRPQDNPLIVHISNMNMLETVAEITNQCFILAKAFWPGPLTIILHKKSIIPYSTSAGLETVGVRMPRHPVAQQIIEQSGLPLAAPSANLSGKPSPTNAKDLMQDMNGRIPLIIDGGESEVGVESTVISLVEKTPTILRPGYITQKQLKEALGCKVVLANAILHEVAAQQQVQSPGMKYKHYAPKAELMLVKGSTAAYCSYVNHLQENAFALCFEEDVPFLTVPYITYGNAKKPATQTHRLFTALRELDQAGAKKAYVHVEQSDDIYLAIYNRLLRASEFRVVTL